MYVYDDTFIVEGELEVWQVVLDYDYGYFYHVPEIIVIHCYLTVIVCQYNIPIYIYQHIVY